MACDYQFTSCGILKTKTNTLCKNENKSRMAASEHTQQQDHSVISIKYSIALSSFCLPTNAHPSSYLQHRVCDWYLFLNKFSWDPHFPPQQSRSEFKYCDQIHVFNVRIDGIINSVKWHQIIFLSLRRSHKKEWNGNLTLLIDLFQSCWQMTNTVMTNNLESSSVFGHPFCSTFCLTKLSSPADFDQSTWRFRIWLLWWALNALMYVKKRFRNCSSNMNGRNWAVNLSEFWKNYKQKQN